MTFASSLAPPPLCRDVWEMWLVFCLTVRIYVLFVSGMLLEHGKKGVSHAEQMVAFIPPYY